MSSEHLPDVDPLTRLFNHRHFQESLQTMLDETPPAIVSLVMVDIDHLKGVNDAYGHLVADTVLVTLASITSLTVAAMQLEGRCCRIGGDEFAILLPEEGRARAAEFGATLAKRIREADLAPVRQVTVSVGVAEGPSHGANAGELFQAADIAMFAAKRAGRDRVVTYQPELRDDIGEEEGGAAVREPRPPKPTGPRCGAEALKPPGDDEENTTPLG